jgi:hypothetical protein
LNLPVDTHRRRRRIGRLLVVVWVLFWIVFGLAISLGEHQNLIGTFAHIVPGLVFLILGILTFTWPRGGALLLLATGVAVAILFPVWAHEPLLTTVFIEVVMALPAIFAGALLLLSQKPSAEPTVQ